ncbi:MAG: CdaR family protein [Pyrinomonadaceae bacterium]
MQPFFVKQILRKIFLEDWSIKLIALVVTLALWLGVTGLSTPTTKRFTVPLNFSISNDAEITSSPIQEVDVVVSGDKRRIEQINRAELAASIDLSELAAGDRVLSLTPENVSVPLPLGIKLDRIEPSRIAVRLEAVEEKDIAVKAETNGDPASGFEVYGQTITPPKIRVRGPASFVRTLDFVMTDRIDISGTKEDVIARQVPVSVANGKAAVLNTVVDVAIRVGEKRIEKTFVVPASTGRKVAVTLYGPKTMLEHTRADEVKAEILKTDGGDDSPRVSLPDNLQDSVEIRTVKIRT